jgi:hypothetical protein
LKAFIWLRKKAASPGTIAPPIESPGASLSRRCDRESAE